MASNHTDCKRRYHRGKLGGVRVTINPRSGYRTSLPSTQVGRRVGKSRCDAARLFHGENESTCGL